MKKLKLLLATCALMGGVFSANAQKDITSQYITNATLKDGYGPNSGWTATGFHAGPTQGHNTTGYAVECWAGNNNGQPADDRKNFSLTQDITLPKGSYRLVNYSFYRQSWTATDDASKSLAYLKAGNQQTKIMTLGSISGQTSYADGMSSAANRFDTKMYRNVVEFDVDADNTVVNIGVTGTHDAAGSWFICGMFELFDLNDVATVDSPTDMTYAIKNPGFEYLNLTGWTNAPDGAFWYMDNGNWGNDHKGAGWVEKWAGSNFPDASLSQTLTNLPNGLYEVTVMAQARGGNGYYLYANNDKTAITDKGDYSVRTTVTDGNLTIKVGTESFGGDWTPVDHFRLKFYGDPLKAYQDLLGAAVAEAQALIDGAAGSAISTTAKAAWQAIVDANDNDDKAFTAESQFSAAIENITNANTNYQAMAAPYAKFQAMKEKANGIKNQTTSYTDTEGAVSTLENVINTADAAVEAALTAAAISEQTENVRIAAFAFLGNVTLNDNATIDITAFIVNAGFDEVLTSGWNIADYTSYDGGNNTWYSYSTSYSCGEFYQAKFNISQTLTDLPAGKSFKLKVQAFQRPGDIATVYSAYGDSEDKTKNVTSEIYVNEKAQKIKNIVSEYSATELFDGTGVEAWMKDSNPASDVYVPNSMKGASIYFGTDYAIGIKFYESEVAAAANSEGTLQFGFRDNTSGAGAWTIFDNFRLYYAGDDLSGFAADLTAVISSVKTAIDGMTFGTELKTKLKDIADSYERPYSSADDYTAAITAVNSIEAIGGRYVTVCALTKRTANENVGDGVFQLTPANDNTLWSALSTEKDEVEAYSGTTISDFETLVISAETAADNYKNNQVINAPKDDERYWVSIVDNGKNWNGNAITFIAGARTTETQGGEMGGYGIKYLAPANANLNQALKFTAVDNETNTYKVSAINVADGGERYITTGSTYSGGNNSQIRTTDDDGKASWIKIQATSTNGQFQLLNVSDGNKVIANSGNNNDMYTANSCNFTIAKASPASVDVNIAGDVNYATRIFPFTPTLPGGVTAYSCSVGDGNVLTLTEVTDLAANTPYILEAPNGYSGNALAGWGTAAATSYEAGYLTGVYEATEAPDDAYVLAKIGDEVAFYQVDNSDKPSVPANRCYVTAPSNGARALYFPSDDATAISALKALTSGEATIYNVNGAQIPSLQKGMNIIRMSNGTTRKVMVK